MNYKLNLGAVLLLLQLVLSAGCIFFRLAEAGRSAVRATRLGRAGIAGKGIVGVMRRFGLVPMAALILAAGEVAAEHRVLFIGNSLTFGYGSTTGVPDLFDRLARAGGQDDPVTLMRAIGGADFQQHAGNVDTLAAINSQAWTHVVLQNHSSEPTHLTPNNGRSIADHLTFGRALYDRVMENNSASKVILYETWSRAASHPIITGTSTNTTFANTAQFQNELRTNYRLLRDNLNNEFPDALPVAVARVGSAWELAGALLPLADPEFVDLFMANETPDYGYHANDRGTYLAACVFYAKIYGSSPVGLHQDPLISSLNLNFGADPGMPAFLEATAWEVVANGTDPVTIIGNPASASVPEGHPLEFQVNISGEPPFAVQWKKNGVPIAGATCKVLRITAAWASLNGAQFTVDVSNAVSQVTSTVATLSVTPAAPYSVLMDFGSNGFPTVKGSSPNDPLRHWNNVLPAVGATSNGKLARLLTSQNVPTLLDFQMLSRFNNSIELGATTTTVGLPPNATRDCLWGNTQVSNGLTNVFPQFRIDGLAPSWRHTLTFFASRTGVSDSRQTRYTVTGTRSASVDLEVANNTTRTAMLVHTASSQAGTLEVALSPGPSNNSSSHFTYLGSLQIDAVPGPAPRAVLDATVTGNGSIAVSPAQADHAVGEFINLNAEPAPGWVFAGWSGDASGATNPLVVVIDSDPTITATFVAKNTPPTISAIADRLIDEDTSTGAIAFTIGDAETPASLLVVNKYSSNHEVVAPSGLVQGGSATSRRIIVTPLPNANGTTTITVSVTDGELSSEIDFLVTVVPMNDPPTAQDAPFAVAENSPPAKVVGSVTASDPDDGQSLGFAITAGNEGGAFAIEQLTGEITVAGVLNFETQPQYVLTVTVTDDHVPRLSDTATITINITDVISEALQAFPAWLAGFGLTAEPSDDSDVGGLNNLNEFLFAYDPTDPSDDLLFRLELVIGNGNIEVAYPELMPVGDYHLSVAADPSQLTDPANRVETISKAQIGAMSEAARKSRTYTTAQGAGPVFFGLEFESSPLE